MKTHYTNYFEQMVTNKCLKMEYTLSVLHYLNGLLECISIVLYSHTVCKIVKLPFVNNHT